MTTLPSNYIADYLLQLGLPGNLSGLELVSQLQIRHLAEFSFSSINALYGDFLSLEETDVFTRVIANRQGGYCFEHNKIACMALAHLGFEVRPVLARVMLNGLETNPRTHRVTLLTLAGCEYLVDVGFGVKTPILPLKIDSNNSLEQGVNQYLVERKEQTVKVSIQAPEQLDLYEVDLSVVYEGDCDVAHFYSHQHPEAGFVNNLVVSRIESGQRHLIRNLHYLFWNEHTGEHTQCDITGTQQLQGLLQEHFRLQISPPVIEKAFAKVHERVNQQR
ncbi:N-hydroxyarylamine O-acetyltransferase [Pseudoalteromonas citrea]|uniref:N-hydroxyarylamine O-acetyltransferase n=2 Tax=Pseudoalteromonas citrea TaxID=43655 RepID=A0AAD4FQQ6_9GAMM|nr:arylamine N-acetyltransferase [Pseudoalteromonas citrea]KAF7767656.1 N-hydroxyarylamine O-acetyltransferase [Pseudoalteromonas citrea]